MKEKKKSVSRVIVRAALILLLLTLISGCFLGSTFARYVSKGDGSFTAGIAKWDITSADKGAGEFVTGLDEFSPNLSRYQTGVFRSRSVTVDLFTITNSGDVDAYIRIDLGTAAADAQAVTLYSAVSGSGSGSDTPITLPTDGTGENQYAPDATEIDQIFTVTLAGVKTDESKTVDPVTDLYSEYCGMYLLPAKETITVQGKITWTTDLANETNESAVEGWNDLNVVEGDLRDTWIGQNVVAIGWNYTWYALQASEQPTTGGTSTPSTTLPTTP